MRTGVLLLFTLGSAMPFLPLANRLKPCCMQKNKRTPVKRTAASEMKTARRRQLPGDVAPAAPSNL